MKRIFSGLIIFIILLTSTHIAAVAGSGPAGNMLVEKVVITSKDTMRLRFVHSGVLYSEGWDTLAQARFWKQIMRLSPDSCLVNVAATRAMLHTVGTNDWHAQSEDEKLCYKNNVCAYNALEENTSIFVTSGKSAFYELKKSIPNIARAIEVFEANNTDPWYAQAIILIESPGKMNAKSSVGANGPFQLMRAVALKYGLTVNKYSDERENLPRAAGAAARFISSACIPGVKRILEQNNFTEYSETDLWFRLLVLHAYHAGAGNLAGVVAATGINTGGMELIRSIWQTEYGTFKNQSQNYSQIALAAIVSFDQIINQASDSVHLVTGNRLWAGYSRNEKQPEQSVALLKNCITAYENDLMDGTITFEEFIARAGMVQKELNWNADRAKQTFAYQDTRYPFNEKRMLQISNHMLAKRRSENALSLLQMNLSAYPNSLGTIDQMSRAYKMSGNKVMAQKYTSMSVALRNTGMSLPD